MLSTEARLPSGSRVDSRTDVWALGVIAFEALTGRRPFEGEQPWRVWNAILAGRRPMPSQVADVPAGFDAWFDQAVAQDPEQRFLTVDAAVTALFHACGAARDSVADREGSRPAERVDAASPPVQRDAQAQVTAAASVPSMEPTVDAVPLKAGAKHDEGLS
ncbi:MAG: hypothetical protein JW940_39360 [Polyangiaceae bacterium]|nr:hypothetical protein [Polyangiaceae bacterium]